MQKEQGDLLKKMMNDPAYQQMMMNVLSAPHMQSEYLSLMKTKPYREQMQKVIMQTVSSPLFSSQVQDAIKKVINEEIKKGSDSGGKSSQQPSPQGGGQ
jgi:spore germination protein D